MIRDRIINGFLGVVVVYLIVAFVIADIAWIDSIWEWDRAGRVAFLYGTVVICGLAGWAAPLSWQKIKP